MIVKNKKSGMITTELAISLVLVAAVLFITLGMFSDNLKTMIASGNFENIFNRNDIKTGFNTFSKDYADSQINVQIMGSQGLEMLRRKANNKILDIMKTTTPDPVSVLYLAMAINVMVGSPDACVYMVKNSDKYCPKTKPGGYEYKITLGPDPTIIKSDKSGIIASGTSSIGLISTTDAQTAFASAGSHGSPSNATSDAKYSYIEALTTYFGDIIPNDVKLINGLDNTSNKGTQTNIEDVKKDLNNLLAKLSTSISNNMKKCSKNGNGYFLDNSNSDCHSTFIGHVNKQDFTKWVTAQETNIKNSDVTDIKKLVNNFIDSTKNNNEHFWSKNNTIIEIMQFDDYTPSNRSVSCSIFKDTLKTMEGTYNIKILIPDCTPYSEDYSTDGVQSMQ